MKDEKQLMCVMNFNMLEQLIMRRKEELSVMYLRWKH